MKKTMYPILGAALLLSACGSPSAEQTVAPKDSTSVSTEASLPVMDPALFELTGVFTDTKALSFAIDAQKIDELKPGKELKGADVKLLMQSPVKDELFVGMDYTLGEFMRIDSIKAKGKYDEYVKNIELGETQDSRAYAYAKANTGPDSFVLFWIHESHSTEACPYSYAKTVYATAISNNEVGQTIVFADQSGGSDAPVYASRKLTGTMTDSSRVLLSVEDVSGDDEPSEEIVEAFYELKLKDGKFSFVSKSKKAPRKEKKKA
jgi:hypothetical protein